MKNKRKFQYHLRILMAFRLKSRYDMWSVKLVQLLYLVMFEVGTSFFFNDKTLKLSNFTRLFEKT